MIITVFSIVFSVLMQLAVAQGSWAPTGPEGRFLLIFAIAPDSPDILYSGCDVYGGIYKRTNGDLSRFADLYIV